MGRMVAFLYGAVAYLIFLATFIYAIGFVGNLMVPVSIDAGGLAAPVAMALLINVLLLGVFAVQHSVMARPGFKKMWTRIVPPVIERSTYVLLSSLALALLFWQWRPMTAEIWNLEGTAVAPLLTGLFFAGWGLVLLSTFLISHWDLFGLRQVYLNLTRKEAGPIGFQTPLLYKLVRHPLLLGFIIAFWATPLMTVGHLLFAAGTTIYMLIAIQLEERDLVTTHGDEYRQYQKNVRMLIPIPKEHSTQVPDVITAPATATTAVAMPNESESTQAELSDDISDPIMNDRAEMTPPEVTTLDVPGMIARSVGGSDHALDTGTAPDVTAPEAGDTEDLAKERTHDPLD